MRDRGYNIGAEERRRTSESDDSTHVGEGEGRDAACDAVNSASVEPFITVMFGWESDRVRRYRVDSKPLLPRPELRRVI